VGVKAAAAVELVHNFSLLHDDVMDGDTERRHRPTAWTVFGVGQTILAGSALLVLAVQLLNDDGEAGARALPSLLTAVDELIRGQSADLRLEGSGTNDLEQCLAMEAGKTASLLACSASIGALAAGAPAETVRTLAAYGTELGMAFQLVDDVLGITGDPARTGKSSSSDVRAGKTSAPIAAALADGGPASHELARMLQAWPPTTEEDVARATDLVLEAGGIAWAEKEADRRLDQALKHLDSVDVPARVRTDLGDVATYVARRDS
jgi:geranylgeranyl diphosphate synthase type I